MRSFTFALAALTGFALACDGTGGTGPAAGSLSNAPIGGLLASTARPVHFASVGGADLSLVPPGGDANFSLVAMERADGSISGQWQDQFAGGVGFHATVTCLHVRGNQAWIGGTITKSLIPVLVGLDALTTVVDNGQTGDLMTFSFIGTGVDCRTEPAFLQPLVPPNNGQVIVR